MSYLKNKPNSLEDMAKQMNIHTNESGYKEMFKKELDKTGRAGVGAMTPKEKNEFFSKIDSKQTVKENVDWKKAAETTEKLEQDAKYFKTEDSKKIPPIAKDNKPGVKIAKIRAMKDGDGAPKEDGEMVKLKGQVELLRQKLENEKHKAVKPMPNKETGEVPLSVGIAYKHLRDKMKTEAMVKREKTDTEAMPADVPLDTTERDKKLANPKGKTMTGEPKSPVEMNPKINHSF
jgi:hypothetical protein